MALHPAVKWTGSKRTQADAIIQHFPRKIDTYYEPFVGGGSVMFSLLHHPEVEVKHIICRDINEDLINLWVAIMVEPERLLSTYERRWLELNVDEDIARKKEYYHHVRDRFNELRDPADFIFLNRTAINGLIRYNGAGDFNSAFHFNRKGMNPDTLREIVEYWSSQLNEHKVIFEQGSYEEIETERDSVVYCDPPYSGTKGMYYGKLDYDAFWSWIEKQRGTVLFSFDGKREDHDFTFEVPSHIYDQHIYLSNGASSFSRLKTKNLKDVYESLYIHGGSKIIHT